MLRRYDLRDSPWATILLDTSIGFFATVSDFGNYAYVWSAPGCEFRKFLTQVEPDYFHGKIMFGRPDQMVYDPDETEKAVKAALRKHNKRRDPSARLPLPGRDCSLATAGDFKAWRDETPVADSYDCYRERSNPRSWGFCTKILPRFQQLLRDELKKETEEGITTNQR